MGRLVMSNASDYIRCPECQTVYERTNIVCPNCGVPNPDFTYKPESNVESNYNPVFNILD